jgi:nicotinamide riboside kinase
MSYNKIGLCGSMSVGKSTLIKNLAQLPQFSDYKIATERSKYLRDLGIPLNTDSTILGQSIFLAERCSELLHPKLLTDRSIIDVMAFTLLAKSISESEKKNFIEHAKNILPHYDIIFFINSEGMKIEDNNVRETDPHYRQQVENCILDIIHNYSNFIKKVVFINDINNDNRIQTILNNIKDESKSF